MSAPSDLLFRGTARRPGVHSRAVSLAGLAGGNFVLRTSALLALALTQGATVAHAQSADVAAASKVKINPTKRTLRFTVPVTDGPNYLGEINLAVTPDDALSVDSARLLQMLEPVLKAETMARLKLAIANNAEVTEAQLATEKITLAYDSEKLALAVGVPVSARGKSSVSLRSASGTSVDTLEPASFSGFVNFRAATDIIERGSNRGVAAPISLVDGAIRLLDVVAEGEAYFSLRSNEPLFRRTGSRLTYDDLKNVVRWSLGDVTPFTRSFQQTRNVAGLSASRFYSVLEPWREFRSTGSQSFSILAASTVETVVNGRTMERKLLQPGNYTLQDFPLAEGANDVQLIIRDEAGRQRTIEFNLYSNRQLLEPGTTEFSTFAGVYSDPTGSGIRYSRDWSTSGFVRKGLSQQLTGGLNMQADADAQQTGVELLLGTGLGLIGADLAASRRTGGGTGYAGVLTYERVIQTIGASRSLSLRALAEARSADFATPGGLNLREPLALRASAGWSLTLGRDSFVGFDGQYARSRGDGETRYSARGIGGIHLGETLAAVGELQWEHGRERDGVLARIGLRKRLGSRATAQLDVDTRGGVRSSYQNSAGTGIGAWSGSVDLSRDQGSTSVNANGSYLANRFELGVSQFNAFGGNGGAGVSDMRTSVRVGTSLAFADGVFAVARPIQQAFLIAEPHGSLNGKPVRIDPQQKSEEARSGALGGAVYGTLSAYSPRTLVYDVPEAPPGYDLGAGNVQITPPYKAGYRVEVGSDYHLLVVGRLLDRGGKPITLLAGKATDLRAPKRPALTMFTSRGGKFGAQGFRPGKWRIEMPTEDGPTFYEINVKDDLSGTVRLGDLHPTDQGGVK
jgi:outer membrane usher protein